MIVRYDALSRLEQPDLTLCNPGSVYTNGTLSNVVGILADVTDMEIVFNFNATSELNFRITKIAREDADDTAHVFRMYRSVQNRRLLFAEDIGYFMITNVKDGYDGVNQYKDVQAKSIDVEIAQKMIPYIEDGTYRFAFNSSTGENGLLETIVATIPLWTIGTVDASVGSKYRTFEDVDDNTNCLGFMIEKMQDAYECIFIFDITNRVINVYSQDNYVVETSIHITKDDVIDNLDIDENADDLYTAITVRSNDEAVTIGAINPLGGNTIYDFSYYLSWMTSALSTKVSAWQTAVANAKTNYYNLNLQYYTLLNQINNYTLEQERIAGILTMYHRCRDNIVASQSTDIVAQYNEAIMGKGGTADDRISISSNVQDTLAGIDNIIANHESAYDNVTTDKATATTSANTVKGQIDTIRNGLMLTAYFTASELEELNHYIFEGNYTDEYVIITDDMTYTEKFEQMKTLYDRAAARLEIVSNPTQEFTIDTENFIFVKDFEAWTEQLETGCLINVELDTDDIALLFLSSMVINYEDKSLKLTFGNRFNKFDPKALFDDMLGKISKSANTLSYLKEILYPIKAGELNVMQEALQTSRDLTMGAALSSTNEEVVIDDSGYTGKSFNPRTGIYDPRQIKITGKNIVMTDDAWETCKIAIGELLLGNGESIYGINAQAIIGDIIIGNSLHILDNNGNELFTVIDNKISSKVTEKTGGYNTRMTQIEQNANSINVRVTTLENTEIDHVTTSTNYTFDANGLSIQRSGMQMKNLLTDTGMFVTRNNDPVLSADSNGVDAINLTARQYLIIGSNSRFENYTNGTDSKRTACFYIGG